MENIMNYVFASLNGIFKSIQKSQQQRANYWLLQNMSDRQLKDMGIYRGEIHHKVFKP
jgi:uncharacterized protein YjiS (DUF1127 family)